MCESTPSLSPPAATLRFSGAADQGRLARLRRAALDLLFPPRCVICQRFGSCFCVDCQSRVTPLLPPVCEHCGRPLATAGVCRTCRRAESALAGIRAATLFDEPVRSAIHHLKYRNVRELARPLAALLSDTYARNPLPANQIVPVPLHRRRVRERGYNQAVLLARELGRRLELPVVQDVLVRARYTAPQVGLGARERLENVRDAFRCPVGALSGQRVLLVDDVCTTGATLEACAEVLRRQGGAAAVWGLTVAQARGLDDGLSPASV